MTIGDVATLKLFYGVPSPYTFGAPSATGYDPVPQQIDFINGVLRLNYASGIPDYQYNIATLKNGGIRADSPIIDGSTLTASPVGNVTETLTLIDTTDGTGLADALRTLAKFRRAALDFQNTTYQPKPIYIERQFVADVAPVYALVVNMDFAIQGDTGLGQPRYITVTWEREPYWRAIPPGANPMLYAFQKRELKIGTDFDYQDLDLTAFANADADLRAFVEGNPTNSHAWSGVTTYDNFLDIGSTDAGDADYIPGDAPALACIVVNANTASFQSDLTLFIARNTKADTSPVSADLQAMSHNGGDADIFSVLGITASYQTDTTRGVFCDPPGASAGNYYSAQFVFPTAALGSAGVIAEWTRPMLKNSGRYAVFIRGAVTSGTASEIPLSLELEAPGSGATVDFTGTFTPTASANTSLKYLGNFDMAAFSDTAVSPEGLGTDGSTDYTLQLLSGVRAGVGATSTYRIVDIILLPYDESAFAMGRTVGGISTTSYNICDNTGYFGRGKRLANGIFYQSAFADDPFRMLETTGQFITLEPGITNRLYFLMGDATSSVTYRPTVGDFNVRVNIVPRWLHIRDAL